MNCPWCGKEMLPGKMKVWGNADLMWESTDREYSKPERFFGDNKKRIRCTDKMVWAKTEANALHCRTCKKIVFDSWLE
jgi:hypothetical protein